MELSCCVWALTGPESDNLTRLADMGFTQIDIQPGMLATPALQQQTRRRNLQVSCVGLSFGLPAAAGLDSPESDARRAALTHMTSSLAQAADLGATTAYVVPGFDTDEASLARYADSLVMVADRAQSHGLTLAVEHFPGRALPTAAATLDFLAGLDHPNLYLLFDLGHIQMSREDPVAVIRRAGPRLGYLHLDDNDGVGDLHWSLLDGVMTRESLRATLAAAAEIGYGKPVSLELSPALTDPARALAESRDIVLEYLAG